VNAVRSRTATVVWLVAVVCALFLAVGALLVALGMSRHDGVVSFVLDAARRLDFGRFATFAGGDAGKDAATRTALVSWGLAALGYLVVGKILDRVIRPGAV
jgi:hypothetical protein